MEKKRTVLVIDDEPGILDLLSHDLRREGFEVATATNGQEGLERVEAGAVDLVISDIRMSVMGGLELLKELRTRFRGPSPAIILISGHLGVGPEVALSMGAQALFTKPFGRTELLEKVRDLLLPAKVRWRAQASAPFDLSLEIEIKNCDLTAMEGKLVFGWGGMFLHTPEVAPEAGQVVRFEIKVLRPREILLKGFGKVVWRRDRAVEDLLTGIGVEFTSFEPEFLEDAISWVESCAPSAYIPIGRPGSQ